MELRRTLRPFATAAALLVLALALVALGYWLAVRLIPRPQIAVISLDGEIWGSYTAYLSQAMEQAGDDPAVKAVVIDISSPGGEVSASEGLYFDILALREKKPVVASIDEMAASGAYYAAAAADRIYAKPGSMVGNIGVISVLPEPDLVDDVLITTGPFKLSGGSQVAYVRQMEMMKETFLAAIVAQREGRLTVGREVLSRGEIWLGLQAQQMGLIDAVGSQSEAIAAAAKLARVRHYLVSDRTPALPEESLALGRLPQGGQTAATIADLARRLPPGYYYRYVEPVQ